MITVEIDASDNGIEILVDESGVDELIDYLQYIKSENESMHLLAGNELGEELVNKSNDRLVKHVKLIVYEP